ncbi:hypothetical protein KPH14_008069 [Odynerus spinipes]|uniref:Uncharacterized protein n=1 Tax=Odynerus spinipes TaxID=1348599 RepID=A0AAD9RK58_9HYME|nr:hypothetical protein KPH14_008069 [Odynerus spinipes]
MERRRMRGLCLRDKRRREIPTLVGGDATDKAVRPSLLIHRARQLQTQRTSRRIGKRPQIAATLAAAAAVEQ